MPVLVPVDTPVLLKGRYVMLMPVLVIVLVLGRERVMRLLHGSIG